MKTVLFVSHIGIRCGVHDYGLNVYEIIRRSLKYKFVYAECASEKELARQLMRSYADAIIYNYHPATLPWVTPGLIRLFSVPQIGTIHEVTQSKADRLDGSFFDYYVTPDPSLKPSNPIVFKTGRPLPAIAPASPPPARLTVGSFGFGTAGKGFGRIVEKVCKECGGAVVRLNIPSAQFGDPDGSSALRIAEVCRSIVTRYNPSIDLRVTHIFMAQVELLQFLSQNTLNLFMYLPTKGRGIASVTDYALAAGSPFGVSDSSMFRHVYSPDLDANRQTVDELIQSGAVAADRLRELWSPVKLMAEYERMMDCVFDQWRKHQPIRRIKLLAERIRERLCLD